VASVYRKARTVGRLGHAALATVAAEAGLRLLPLATTARLMGAPLDLQAICPPAEHEPDIQMARAWAATRWVLRHGPTRDTCLRRVLVAGHLLRRRRPVLRLGATSAAGRLGGHAWIEFPDGRTLGAAADVVPFSVTGAAG
jgi:hypothetical protein